MISLVLPKSCDDDDFPHAPHLAENKIMRSKNPIAKKLNELWRQRSFRRFRSDSEVQEPSGSFIIVISINSTTESGYLNNQR